MRKQLWMTRDDGFVAFMTVLIVGTISLSVALWLLTLGTDSQRWVIVQQAETASSQTANACAEEALQLLQATPAYTGTGNLSVNGVTCSYTVINTGGNSREIDVSTTGAKTVTKLKIYVTINATNISVTSWQEVP